MAFYDQVLEFLLEPYEELCERSRRSSATADCATSLGPLEGFTHPARDLASTAASSWPLPVILWQIWRFIVPGAARQGEEYAIPFVVSSVVLFLLGGVIAYRTLGAGARVPHPWAGDDVDQVFQVNRYIGLVGLMIAAFGIGFEFPVLLVFLQLVGVLTPRR